MPGAPIEETIQSRAVRLSNGADLGLAALEVARTARPIRIRGEQGQRAKAQQVQRAW